MNIAFIHNNEIDNCNIARGAGYIAAAVMQAGHALTYYDTYFTQKGKIAEEIINGTYDVVMVSSMSMLFHNALQIIQLIKQRRDVPVILGGLHAIIERGSLLEQHPEIDYLCLGEGLTLAVDFLRDLGTERLYAIQGLAFRKDGRIVENPCGPPDDLSTLPPFPWHFFPRDVIIHRNGFIFLTAARGCPYSCRYCCNSIMLRMYGKKFLRFRPVEDVIQEIAYLKETYRPGLLFFFDEMILFDLDYARALFEAVHEHIRLPYGFMARVEYITPETVQWLKATGCRHVSLGVECANEPFRKKYLNRHMSNAEIARAFGLLSEAGMYTVAFNMLGFPVPNDDELTNETLAFNLQLPIDRSEWSIFYPFPGTPLRRYCEDNDLIDPEREKHVLSIRHDSILRGVTLAPRRLELMELCNAGKPAFQIHPPMEMAMAST
ncbi:MAG: B12-binding domain-containing radical SAM protein [Spartobacteria bacterium]|nr:B12-binding domain-containing radical SAM protein [Spartobacteria bacterium]